MDIWHGIADNRKTIGHPQGLAELMMFYCEQASGFSSNIGQQDEGYFDALLLKTITSLAEEQRQPLWERLDGVCRTSHNFGYGVDNGMDDLLAEYEADD